MKDTDYILGLVKKSVFATVPNATVILYGSYARGDNHEGSDIDLLVLLDVDKVTYEEETKITYPLYDIEFATGILINPMVYPKKVWETRYKKTPFYKNVSKDGIVL